MQRIALIPVLLLALCACHRDDEALAIGIADGFQPLSISVQIEDESLTLTFLTPERAQIIVATQAQEHLDDDEPVIRTVGVIPGSYPEARSRIIALMTANGIRAEDLHGPGIHGMSISLGGDSGQVTMTIARNREGDLPVGCQALRMLVESYRHAPDLDVRKGR
jgi:hypothetical protein